MIRIAFAFLLTILVSFVAKAESVSKSDAFNTAQQYLLSKGKILNQSITPYRSVRKVNGQPESAYYYVFNAESGNGYVIVSGDDRTPEILGYVDNGSFDKDNIPENMKSWLQLYVDQIKYLADNNITVDKRAIKARAKAQATRHSVPVLVSTRWNQGKPYNITCPDYYLEEDSKESTALPLRSGPASGCVATAMAQVVNFYKFPNKLKTQIPASTVSYTSEKDGSKKSITQKAIPRNTPIDWENMRDTYNWEDGHVANAQDSAVANLIHMCGQAVNMHYGPSSGAVTSNAKDVFLNYFGFDDSAYWVDRSSCSIDEWFDALYQELSAGYPILFSGHSSGGGHAFVIDGFDGEQLFHVNWGWGGGSDGWFLIGILNPGDNSGIGASSSSDGYSMGQGALLNLRLPDKIKVEKSTCMTIHDIKVSGTTISGHFINWTGATNSFSTGIVKINDDNTLSLVSSTQTCNDMSKNTYKDLSFNIKGRLKPGTYRLSPASKLTSNKIYRPELDMKRNYILAEVDSSKNITLTYVRPVEDICVDTIVYPGSLAVNENQEIKVTFRNNGDEYYREIYMFASQTDEKIYTKSRSIVAVRKGETVDVSYFFKPEETGTYNLWFCTDDKGNDVIGQDTMVIKTESQFNNAKLTISSYTISNLVNGVIYGKQMVGKAAIKNNAKEDFKGKIKLQLWHQPNSTGTAWTSSSHTYDVDIMAGKIANVDFHFDNLTENNKYYISASFVNRSGDFGNAGVWDLGGWEAKSGVELWKPDGTLTGKAFTKTFTAVNTSCGVYFDCPQNLTRLTPNKNPNTIYGFSPNMAVPNINGTCNVVSGNHASNIKLDSDNPFYIPCSFKADTATFVYTFPADLETDIVWQTITMPFNVDSICRGDFTYQLNDTLNHFWIFEFAETDDDGNPVFKPATVLRGNTPYIIACDSLFKGMSITFTGFNKNFYKTGSDKMIVSSDTYCQYGCTYQPKIKNVYMLNERGTAFEYVTTTKTLPAISSYFTTKLAEEEKLERILLPEIPWSCSKSAGWGDINLDQKWDDADVEALARTLVLKTPEGVCVEYGDVDGDGKITIADLVSLINKVNE